MLFEGLLVSSPRTVEAVCATQIAGTPQCSTSSCKIIPNAGYGYCGNDVVGDCAGNCGAPGYYSGHNLSGPTWFECGAAFIPGTGTGTESCGGQTNSNCVGFSPQDYGIWWGCAGTADPTPTPTTGSGPPGATNTPVPGSPTNTPTPTPTPTRPALCQSTTVSSSTLSSGGSLTITSTANTSDITTFTYAFYNEDNLADPNNPATVKPIFFTAGTHYQRSTTNPPDPHSDSITVTYDELNHPDLNWGGQKPIKIHVNGYFTNSQGFSWPDANCVVQFTVSTPTPTPTPTNTPTPTPTPVNGVCSDPDIHNNCNAGNLGASAGYDNSWEWWCNGINGGTNALCHENKIMGTCSATHNNCSTGTTGWTDGTSFPDRWEWWCNGSNANHPPPPDGFNGYGDILCSQYKPCTCTISANPGAINYNDSSTIAWSSTNATSCTVSSPSWTGTSGSQNTGSLTAPTTTYTANCSGPGGSCSCSTTVATGDPLRPTLTCTANSDSITWNWTPSPGPVTYWLQVNPNSGTTNPDGSFVNANTFNSWLSSLSTTTAGTPGVYYYSQVLSGDTAGRRSSWSTPVQSCRVPCLTTAPTNLTSTALTCENTILHTYNWDTVPGASGYLFQLYVTVGGTNYWCKNESVGNITSYTPLSCDVGDSADTRTGAVTWRVRAQYPNNCADSSFTTGAAYSVDKSASNVPTGLDLTCHLNGSVDASWNAAADVGCIGLHSTPYWAQVSTDPTFATAINTAPWLNTWTSGTSKSTAIGAFSAEDVVYGHVRSRDGFDQQSAWSAPALPVSCTIPTPLPPTPACDNAHFNSTGNAKTPIIWSWTDGAAGIQVRDNPLGLWWYNNSAISPLTINGIRPGPPNVCGRAVDGWYGGNWHSFSSDTCIQCPLPANKTVVISGNLRQRSGPTAAGCFLATPANKFNVTTLRVSSGDTCVTAPPCPTDGVTYTCTVTFDNAACVAQSRQPDPDQTLTLTANADGYPAGQFSNASCDLNGLTLDINADGGNRTEDIAFPFTGDTWFKTKNTSFTNSSTVKITVPIFASVFPGSEDVANTPFFIIGEAGSALFNSGDVGVSPDTKYSDPRNWHAFTSHGSVMNPGGFINYIKSRKSYQLISDLADNNGDGVVDLEDINADGIYIWTGGALTISDLTNFDHNIVLMSEGEIRIDKEPFTSPSSKSLAIVANIITFTNTTHKATGLFIANTINTGNPVNQGLQIVGNLIALYTFNNERSWSNTSIPSIFVEFDPSQYVALFPYLSTASYDWRQIQ